MAKIYRQNGSIYDASNNQKIPDVATLQKNYAGATEIKAPTIPFGATKISGPSGLQGLKESDIYRSGTDIYKLPSSVSSDVFNTPSATIKPVTPDPTSVDAMMAGVKTGNEGILAQLQARNATLQEQTNLNAIQKRQADYTEANKTSQTDLLNQKLNQYGTDANVAQVQKLMPQIASTTAAFDNYSVGLEGRTASASSIYGRQALAQRQKAVEVAGLSAVAQAYQGNIDMARNLANDAINAQYQDQTNYINGLNTQLETAYTDLTAAEKKRADSLMLVNEERLRAIEVEKETKQNISNIAITLAQKGVDSSIVNQVLKAPTYEEAIRLASESGGLTTIGGLQDLGNGQFRDESTGIIGTISQIQQEQNLARGIISSPSGNFYDWTTYNRPGGQEYIKSVQNSINNVGKLNNEQELSNWLSINMPNSNITSQDVINAANQTGVGWEEILGLIQKEAPGGASGVAMKNNNFGGITWSSTYQASHPNVSKGSARPAKEGGNYVKFNTVEDGLIAQAEQFAKRKTTSVATTPAEQKITEDGYDVSKFTPEFYNTDFGQKVINNEQQQFNSFKGEQIVKDYNSVQNKAASVQSIIDSGVGGPGDLALVFEFMKSLDPTSVVRESEYEAAAKSGNIFTGAYARFNGYLKEKGGFLPEQVKKAFLDITNQKLGVIENQYNNLRGEYRRIASTQGLNPENVAPDLTITKTTEQVSPESSWLQEQGYSSQSTIQEQPQEEPKSSAWNWFRGLFGAKPQQSMSEKVRSLIK